MYASSRTLMSLAIEGKAPRIFSVVNSRGVPFNSLLLTTFIGSFSFLGILFGEAFIFEKLLSLTGITGVLTWISISVIHLRFRAALKAQNYNLEETLPYIAPLYPFLDFIGLLIGGLIIILQAYSAIKNDGYYNIFSSFVGVPIFLFLFVSFKLIAKSRLVDPKEADLETDNIWTVENERILD